MERPPVNNPLRTEASMSLGFQLASGLTLVGPGRPNLKTPQAESRPGGLQCPIRVASFWPGAWTRSILFHDFVRIFCMCCSCALKLLWDRLGGPVFGASTGARRPKGSPATAPKKTVKCLDSELLGCGAEGADSAEAGTTAGQPGCGVPKFHMGAPS